jgi:hypothetical protein
MTKNVRPGPPRPGGRNGHRYRDRIYDDKRHDPYEASGQVCRAHALRQPAARCTIAALAMGRAQPRATRRPAHVPARIADALPAGEIVLEGPFVAGHRDELLGLVRHEGERERAEHPMHRVIATTAEGERIVVTTTDVHLPRRIGEAPSAPGRQARLALRPRRVLVRAVWRR